MLTNIFIPKWLRYGLVLMILSQGATNLMHLAESLISEWRISTYHARRTEQTAERYAQELNRCERYGQEMEERLADEREARQQ